MEEGEDWERKRLKRAAGPEFLGVVLNAVRTERHYLRRSKRKKTKFRSNLRNKECPQTAYFGEGEQEVVREGWRPLSEAEW